MVIVKLLIDDEFFFEVCVVFDDICKVRKLDFVNNFWCVLVYDLKMLWWIWESIKEVMVFGVFDFKVKEMFYVVVLIVYGCSYCIYFYIVVVCVKGMIEVEYVEMFVIVGMVVEINWLVMVFGVFVDEVFLVDWVD